VSARDHFGLVGSTIADRFRVERVLGEGGFGVVYAGTHLFLSEPVAIKVLKPTGHSADERERAAQAFLREARILFTLAHPAIVRLYDVGILQAQQAPYAVLELLRGTTLTDEVVRRTTLLQPFTRDDLLATFVPILDGVGFAHDRGVIHRDLKPANLMLVSDGRGIAPKVLDFGTARSDTGRTGPQGPVAAAPMTQVTSGFTPLYAAPEQWDGGYGRTGPHTDVFALGLTILEACLLRYPFEDTSSLMGIFRMVSDESKRPSLVKARPDLPYELEQVLIRALHVAPHERYPDAKEMLAAFRGALKASPTTAPLARPLTPPPPPPAPIPSGAPPAPSHPQAIILAQTTQPHTFVPPRERSSQLLWVIGAAGFAVAAAAIALGIAFALHEDAVTATPQPVTPAPTTTPAPSPAPTPKRPHARSTTPPPAFVQLESAIGAEPLWTDVEVKKALHEHDADVADCSEISYAIDPKLDGALDLTMTADLNGTVTDSTCLLRGRHDDPAGVALCACIEAELDTMKLPPAHGRIGLLKIGSFIASYRVKPRP
jgi:serine/threonine protein kinase